MRERDRTLEEELLAQRKHEEVSNADPDGLKQAATAYLGNDFMHNGAD